MSEQLEKLALAAKRGLGKYGRNWKAFDRAGIQALLGVDDEEIIGWAGLDSSRVLPQKSVNKSRLIQYLAAVDPVTVLSLIDELATLRTQLSEALDKIDGLDSDLFHCREMNAELETEVAHLRRVEAGAVRQADELAAMRGVVEAAWRVDACEDPEAEETAHAFDDLRKRLVALDALTKAEG